MKKDEEYRKHLDESLHDDFIKLDKEEQELEIEKQKEKKKKDDNLFAEWETILEHAEFDIKKE